MGRLSSVTRGGNTHFTYTYSSTDLDLLTETQNDAIVQQRVLTRKRDAYLRPTGYKLGTTSLNNAISEVTYTYDTAGRFSSLTYQRIPAATMPPPPPSQTFTYDYEYEVASASHVRHGSGTAKQSLMPFGMDGPQHSVTKMYHATRDALQSISNLSGVNNPSTFDYNYNAIGQREGVGLSSGFGATSEWISWGYDAKGQVVSADSDAGTAGTSDDRFYSYDQIGNRIQSRVGTATSTGGTATTNYYADAGATSSGGSALNQYGSIVTGVNAADPVHDDDGNLVDDGAGWDYAWDGENRMISATPKVPTSGTKVGYVYDYLGRLCARRFFNWNVGTSSWNASENYRYVYDGWNRIESYLDWNLLQDEYVWGLDLSGTLQGAGGVGGMLQWVTSYNSGSSWNNYYPLYDGNGNVTELLNDAGAVKGHWDYDPFGNTLRSMSVTNWYDPGNLFEFRFSTKPEDRRTGLYYYGYRYYDPVNGRWSSRDPKGEEVISNLYSFIDNDGVNVWDILGLQGAMPGYAEAMEDCKAKEQRIAEEQYDKRELREKDLAIRRLLDEGGCNEQMRARGKEKLVAQYENRRNMYRATGVNRKLFLPYFRDGEASCYNQNADFLAGIVVPPCWECHLENGRTPMDKPLKKSGDHWWVICRSYSGEEIMFDAYFDMHGAQPPYKTEINIP
ncbi:RHS repeat-associated core domain-containing protein [Haloferula sp. BvORR071]|uniref:RHS repeat domain-containing protein n=1 Tax=Haloferula sp. BvORR071 TaxID=1396141 RepID=UPI0005532D77|nr:RHS repeat-associated core domain-containing protein [Haloferula sp. BvORR071]